MGVLVAGALVAGLAITGVAVAQSGGDQAADRKIVVAASKPDVERQQGIVLEGSAPGLAATIVEPLQDNGEQIVSKGTNTPLRADVVMSLDGTTIPLDFVPAFAYDLQVRKVALGGS